MEKYLKSLNGISYSDWIKLKSGVDRKFEMQKGEFEKKLKLANPDETIKLIQSQFG